MNTNSDFSSRAFSTDAQAFVDMQLTKLAQEQNYAVRRIDWTPGMVFRGLLSLSSIVFLVYAVAASALYTGFKLFWWN